MMRLMKICLPLVLGPVMMLGQQTQPGTTQKTSQTTAVHRTAAHHKATHRHHRRARTAHKGAKRAAYRPEYTDNAVEVINGNATSKVVFHNEPPAQKARKVSGSVGNGSAQPMKVDVVNGSATNTQYFYGNGQEQVAVRNKPVVVGIQSSDTRQSGGNKHPVVTGITAGSTNDAKAGENLGQPVKTVSPKPKRPAYQPEPH